MFILRDFCHYKYGPSSIGVRVYRNLISAKMINFISRCKLGVALSVFVSTNQFKITCILKLYNLTLFLSGKYKLANNYFKTSFSVSSLTSLHC